MPSLLAIWNNEWITHWNATGRMLRDSLQFTCMLMLNDDISIQWLVVIFRLDNDSGDFISGRTIITTWISNCRIEHSETNSQLCILCNSLSSISPKLNIWIDFSKECRQQFKNIDVQIWMSFLMELQLLLSGVDHVNLCKTGFLARWREKTAHSMMKSALYSKGIDSPFLLKMHSSVCPNCVSISFDTGLSGK